MSGRRLTAEEWATVIAGWRQGFGLDLIGPVLGHVNAIESELAGCRIARDAENDAADAKIGELEKALAEANNLTRILGDRVLALEGEAADHEAFRRRVARPYGWVERMAPDA